MQATIEMLSAIGVFIVGVAARGALILGVILVLSLPVMLIAFALRGAEGLKRRHLGLREVSGLIFRPDLWYAPTHTWLAHRRGGSLAIGLDDLALRLMPNVTGLEVPPAGTAVTRGAPLATVYSGGRCVTIPSPVTGTVAAVNRAALRDPGLVRREGYGRGWMVAVTPADEAFAGLPRGERAERFMRRESARWSGRLEAELGMAAADGGHLVTPAHTALGEASWDRLAAEFLGA